MPADRVAPQPSKEASVAPPGVFISYAREDEKWKKMLETQLNVVGLEGALRTWSDTQLGPGRDFENDIKTALDRAAVAILLVSAQSLTSDFILKTELPAILERQNDRGDLIFIPIIVRDCAWRKVEWLKRLNCVLSDGQPLSRRTDAQAEQTLSKLTEKIHEILESRREKARFAAALGSLEESPRRTSTPVSFHELRRQAGEDLGKMRFWPALVGCGLAFLVAVLLASMLSGFSFDALRPLSTALSVIALVQAGLVRFLTPHRGARSFRAGLILGGVFVILLLSWIVLAPVDPGASTQGQQSRLLRHGAVVLALHLAVRRSREEPSLQSSHRL